MSGVQALGVQESELREETEADVNVRIVTPETVHVRETTAATATDHERMAGTVDVETPLPGVSGAEVWQIHVAVGAQPVEQVAEQVPLLGSRMTHAAPGQTVELGGRRHDRRGEMIPRDLEAGREGEIATERILAVDLGIVPVGFGDRLCEHPPAGQGPTLDLTRVEVATPGGLHEVLRVLVLGDDRQENEHELVLLDRLLGLALELGEGRDLDLATEDRLPALLPERTRVAVVGGPSVDRSGGRRHLLALLIVEPDLECLGRHDPLREQFAQGVRHRVVIEKTSEPLSREVSGQFIQTLGPPGQSFQSTT